MTRTADEIVLGCSENSTGNVNGYNYCYDSNFPSTTFTLSQSETRPYGGSLFFEPIPLEMLKAPD